LYSGGMRLHITHKNGPPKVEARQD
jgi:hypothetical protein